MLREKQIHKKLNEITQKQKDLDEKSIKIKEDYDNQTKRLKQKRTKIDQTKKILNRQISHMQRKRDTRKKIIIGAIAEKYVQENKQDAWFKAFLREELQKRNDCNELFGTFIAKNLI